MFRIQHSLICLLMAALASPLFAAEPKNLLGGEMKPASEQIAVNASENPAEPGQVVTIQPGKEGYPGLDLKPADGEVWDLSAYGHIELSVANTTAKPFSVSLRVDQKGDWKDQPWNTESAAIKPGDTGKVKVIFGYQYGHKPGYKLDPSKVQNIKIFIGKTDEVKTFRIVSLVAGGEPGEKPAIDPATVRVTPPGGKLLGQGVKLTDKQFTAGKNATAALEGDVVKVTFAGKGEQNVMIKPPQGRWRLTDYLQVRVNLKNDGKAPLAVQARVDSPAEPSNNRGPTEWVKSESIAPGKSGEIVIPWGDKAWDGTAAKKSGNTFESNNVGGVAIAAVSGSGEQAFTIESITAAMPPAPKLPDWVGKGPPAGIEGEWTQTLNENFDGDAVNLKTWNVHAANYWDKATHFAKDNVLVNGGFAKLHFEKKKGFHNDDPGTAEKPGKETNYACGFLDSYGKWTQRYGYFETRVKLPQAPGLWPAFWMMPDRGIDAGEQWKRSDTKNGGMEFDALEHLTRWGPTRYNIAFHYDGYQKEHKAIGSDRVYVQPDKDGFTTVGILWTPGSVTYYGNGQVTGKWETDRICNVPMFPIFNIVTGGWDNDPIDDTKLPADLTIDYFRVWQRKDLASDVDGPKPNDGGTKAPQK